MKIRSLLPVVILGLFLGCSDDKPNEPIAVGVEPATATVALGQTQQFTATVTGTDNLAVTWSMDGEATHGTITASGLYSAPAGMPTPATITVRATSQEDGSKSGTATVTVTPAIVVTVSPPAPSIYVNETAAVHGDGGRRRQSSRHMDPGQLREQGEHHLLGALHRARHGTHPGDGDGEGHQPGQHKRRAERLRRRSSRRSPCRQALCTSLRARSRWGMDQRLLPAGRSSMT